MNGQTLPLFGKTLLENGIPRSRIPSLEAATDKMHRALCELDEGNLAKIKEVGVDRLIGLFAKTHKFRNPLE